MLVVATEPWITNMFYALVVYQKTQINCNGNTQKTSL